MTPADIAAAVILSMVLVLILVAVVNDEDVRSLAGIVLLLGLVAWAIVHVAVRLQILPSTHPPAESEVNR